MTAYDLARTTALLRSLAMGESGASSALLPLVYDELHRLASRLMRGERRDHTLQPTALLHEAYLRLVDQDDVGDGDRSRFMRLASKAMRNVLVDHARAHAADKRGGGRARVTLVEGLALAPADAEHVLDVDRSLSRLAEVDAQLAEIVELRFFGGLDNGEVAEALGTSLRSVERGWRLARAWLLQDLEKERGDGR